MVLKERVKAYPEKNGVSVRGTEWSLWIRRVKTKDSQDMFLVKPLKCVYDHDTQLFSYEDMAAPIWLLPRELGGFMKALAEL